MRQQESSRPGFYNPEHHAALPDFLSQAPAAPTTTHAQEEPHRSEPVHSSLVKFKTPTTTSTTHMNLTSTGPSSGIPQIGVSSVSLEHTKGISPRSLIANPHTFLYANETSSWDQPGNASGYYHIHSGSSFTTPLTQDKSLRLPIATPDVEPQQCPDDRSSDSDSSISGDDVRDEHIATIHRSRNEILLPSQSQGGSVSTPRPLHNKPGAGSGKALHTHSRNPSGSHPPARSTATKPRKSRAGRANRSNAETIPDPEQDAHLFTCPFVWYDSIVYGQCMKHGFTRIRDVKQHLRRKHSKPFFCPRCKAVFTKEDELTRHQQQAQCCELRNDIEEPAGISKEQSNDLTRYPERRKDVVAQWNTIWKIVFPNHAHLRPRSPFHDKSRPEAIVSLDAFFRKNLRSILLKDDRTKHVVEEVLHGALLGIGAWEAAMRLVPEQDHVPLEIQIVPPETEQALENVETLVEVPNTTSDVESFQYVPDEQGPWVTVPAVPNNDLFNWNGGNLYTSYT